MAKINGIYVFVEQEKFDSSVSAMSHPVEQGVDITDHVKPNAKKLSISGEIVGANSASIVSQFESMTKAGSSVRYAGRHTLPNAIIKSFAHDYSNKVMGGCKFTMTIEEVRVASSPYRPGSGRLKAVTKAGTQQKAKNSTANVTYTVKKGDTIWDLVNGQYKSLGLTCNEVMAMNPGAFSRKGDFRTLQIGAVLNLGARK